MKRLAALVPYLLGTSPQRPRIELWSRYLERSGWEVKFFPFEDAALHKILYRPGERLLKGRRLLACYVNQARRILDSSPCDALFIHREAALIGPALLERLGARRFRVPVIYDLDDPIFLSYRSPTNAWFSLLKFSGKTHSIVRLSSQVITHNRLLANYVATHNPCVSVIPNCVDTDRYTSTSETSTRPPRLVWIGSHSNMHSLTTIAEPLRKLQDRQAAPLDIIGAGQVELPGVDAQILPWDESTEVACLQAGQIGLAPLTDTPWNRWRTPFKALQYMAVGIPVVASRIGPASEIVEDGVNGFLVATEDEWYDRLITLISDDALRIKMGQAGRATVVERFSVRAQMPRMVSIFEQVLQPR
jgi:glycosyltransferase involved in cell wall biosynthesis